MLNFIKGLFCKQDVKDMPEYASREYTDDFQEKLSEVFKQSGLREGIYNCGSLTLEVSLTKYYPHFDCIVFDKNYNVIYHLTKESLWVTGCRYYVANYQLKLAESYLYKDWTKEG